MAKRRDDSLRPRLVEAAGQAFADQGFAAASMAGIGAAVGVTKGGVYFHFRTKEDLFFAVVEHWRQAHRELLAGDGRDAGVGGVGGDADNTLDAAHAWRTESASDATRAPGPGEIGSARATGTAVSLRGFLVDYLGFHFRHPEVFGLMRVLASEMRGRFTTRVREDHQATLRAVRARIRELLVQGMQDGRLFTTDPALATFVLAAAVEGVLSLVSSAPQDALPFRHPESIVDFLLAPYETVGVPSPSESGPVPDPTDGLDFLPRL